MMSILSFHADRKRKNRGSLGGSVLLAGLLVWSALQATAAYGAAESADAPLPAGEMQAADCCEPSPGYSFCNGIRLQDRIVLVNARPLGCSTNPERMATGLRLKSYETCDAAGCRKWQPYDLESFLSADPSMKTVIFVHGNQISPCEDQQVGLQVYRQLLRCYPTAEPFRFVIFSWPATKIRGPINDYQTKARRTAPVGWELAWLLDQMPADMPIGLIGYSYGARIITGSLHVLGGGGLCGRTLDDRVHPDRMPVRVVLVAAALHSHWLCPGQCHGMAMSQIDRMLLLNNCQDLAMRYYHLSDPKGNPQALGLCGPTCRIPDGWKICNRDMSKYDGPRHDLFRYLSAPCATCQSVRYLTYEEL